MSILMVKEAKITQSNRYPRPNTEDAFAVTHPIGWRCRYLLASLFPFLLLGRRYIALLKEMGGCFALIGKDSKTKPLYKEQKFYLEDIELSEVLTINQNHIKSYYKQEKELVEKMNTYGCSIEKCDNIIDLLLLSKHDFEREKSLKMKMFGKKFENHDSPELTRCYLQAITLGQTFNDDFVFVGKDTNHIPSGRWQTMVFRQTRRIVPPCELAKIRLMMMAFVNKEIMDSNQFKIYGKTRRITRTNRG